MLEIQHLTLLGVKNCIDKEYPPFNVSIICPDEEYPPHSADYSIQDISLNWQAFISLDLNLLLRAVAALFYSFRFSSTLHCTRVLSISIGFSWF